ncbi:MAG: PfkB family carbohydrate kinase [Pseudomonadota bacterium]
MAGMIKPREPDHDLDAVVWGRAGMDLYPLPDGARTKAAETFRADMGGSAGNIAVALARHGLQVGLVAPVSDDPVGRFVKTQIKKYDLIDLTPDFVAGAARTSLALAETRRDANVVIYRNGAADFQMTDQDVAATTRAPALIVTGTALAQEPSRSKTLTAMHNADETILDLDYRAYSWANAEEVAATYSAAVDAADIIIGNDEEFDMLAGGSVGLDRARSIAKKADIVIYKMGEKGAIALQGETETTVPIFPVDMLKPFGAGDAFMGGFIAALRRGKDVEAATRFGAAAAAIVVSRIGCASAMPDTKDVENFIAERES